MLSLDAITNNNKLLKKPNIQPNNFIWSDKDDPHSERRRLILKKYPEVTKLVGPEPLTKYIVIILVLFQIILGISIRNMNYYSLTFWLITYCIGATANQAIFLSIHEVSHMLAFKNINYNKILNIFSNFPIVIPYSITFHGYHIEHHKCQGYDGIDTDIPTLFEALLLTNVLCKTIFCINQILFYALRPMIIKKQSITNWHIYNWLAVLTFDAIIYMVYGYKPILYWLLCDYLAGSLHPCAGHFIAEHYVFVEDFETYSYYGILNKLCFNVGYHNEHHDFPYIPWTRLPLLKKIAPDFYDNIPYHESWISVMWEFITNPNISGRNRIKRFKKN